MANTINNTGMANQVQNYNNYINSGAGAQNIEGLLASVMRESYQQMNEDLSFYANKVKSFNEQKKAIRSDTEALRNAMQNAANGGSQTVTVLKLDAQNNPVFDANGKPVQERITLNKAQLEDRIKNMESALNSVGDDAQLANVDLQNSLQKQQQCLQTLSNVSKMMHDTGMAIIRKIGG